MELFNFEEDEYGALLITVSIDLSKCADDREYLVKDLSKTTENRRITLEQFEEERK